MRLKPGQAVIGSGPKRATEAHELKTRDHTADSQQTVAVRAKLRGAVYDVLSELKHVGEQNGASKDENAQATDLLEKMGSPVQDAPWWMRVLSALCSTTDIITSAIAGTILLSACLFYCLANLTF
jgi:PiT family inorganic phosphate transporter